MSIGKHNVGRMFTSLRATVSGGFGSVWGTKVRSFPQTSPYNVDGVTADQLP